MKSLLFFVSLAAAPLQTGVAPAGSGWAPTGKWVARFDEDRCSAIREYVRGSETLRLNLLTSPLDRELTVRIGAAGSIPAKRVDENAVVRIDGVPVPDTPVTTTFNTQPGRILHSTDIVDDAYEKLRQATRLYLATGKWSYELPLPELAQLTKTLDACDADLLASVGFSKERQALVATAPEPARKKLNAGPEDYPRPAVLRRARGDTSVVAFIGTNGRVTSCRVLKTAGDPDLDGSACKIVRRTKFVPAKDRSGRPMEAPYFVYVRWNLVG